MALSRQTPTCLLPRIAAQRQTVRPFKGRRHGGFWLPVLASGDSGHLDLLLRAYLRDFLGVNF